MKENTLNIKTAIIGGTGLYQLDGFEEVDRLNLKTRWGNPSSDIILACSKMSKKNIAFITRHGFKHNIPPHKVNYRANIWALKELGVKQIISVAAVGGITQEMSPEAIVIPKQIIDYTYSRKHTYFEDELEQVTHIDFTHPYSQNLRDKLLKSANQLQLNAVDDGVYAATQGPRLETAAEIIKLKRDGADIVGMTGMPEASLSRELNIEYAHCALVVNWAAGCAGTNIINHDEMQVIVDTGMLKIKSILVDCIERF